MILHSNDLVSRGPTGIGSGHVRLQMIMLVSVYLQITSLA